MRRRRFVPKGAAVVSSTTDLGKLCKREHDHAGTGMSMRYIHKSGKPIGNCVVCGRENGNKDRDRQIKVRRMKALDQGRFDEKYRGTRARTATF